MASAAILLEDDAAISRLSLHDEAIGQPLEIQNSGSVMKHIILQTTTIINKLLKI